MNGKSVAIFGLREADPERDGELEEVLLNYIKNKGVVEFVFSEYNKFSMRVYNILNKLKKEYKYIKKNIMLKDNNELKPKLDRMLIFDEYYINPTSAHHSYTDEEIIKSADFVLLQELGPQVNKDYIKEMCINLNKNLTIF